LIALVERFGAVLFSRFRLNSKADEKNQK